MNKLKPCPFCGATAKAVHAPCEVSVWHVICENNASHGICCWGRTREAAIKLWNTRTAPANPPLTLDELRDAMEQGTAVYIAKPSGETIMIEQTYAPCVLDTTWVAGIDKPQIVAIYGRNLSFAESEYGITWLAYRHNPGRESEK